MSYLESFKDFIKESPQQEQFEKMFKKQNPDMTADSYFSLSCKLAWELTVCQDRLVLLEGKINSLTDEINKPKSVPLTDSVLV